MAVRPAGPVAYAASTLEAMCGIVGYVGEKQALEVVVAGLRRLEYRGLRLRRGRRGGRRRARGAQEGRQAGQPGGAAGNGPAAASRPPASATPAGRPTAGPPTPTPTRTSARTARVAVIHNGIIENFAELRAELTADGDPADLGDRHRGRRPPAGGAAARRRAATWPRPCGASAADSRAPSPWSPSHARQPDVVVGARRNSPLVVGLGEGENFLASDVAAFVAHTRERHRARSGPGRRC